MTSISNQAQALLQRLDDCTRLIESSQVIDDPLKAELATQILAYNATLTDLTTGKGTPGVEGGAEGVLESIGRFCDMIRTELGEAAASA